ncbi:ArnT family glycosyltransferase [Planctomicrobium piriforme]|nr:hypothetical protein [Planctomicrobium piriforme]
MQTSDVEYDSPLKRWSPLLAVLWLAVYWFVFFSSHLPNASNAERTTYRLDVISLLPEIYAGILGEGSTPSSGIRFLPQRFDLLLVAGLIVASAFAAGRLILRALRLFGELDIPTRWGLAGGLGLSAISLFTLACGVAGLLSRPLFAAAFVALLATEAWITLQRPLTPAPRPLTPSPRWLKALCLAVAIPFLWCMLLGSLLPSTDFDVKEYHLGGPKEYFLAGRVHFLPHNVYTSFPFLTEMLLLAGMVLEADWERGALAGQAVLMAFAPITALGVAGVARRIGGNNAGWLAAMVYLTIPWTYRISIIAYTEGALCCYVVLTLLAFQVWRGRSGLSPGHRVDLGPLLIGLLAGSAVATKYPGMLLVAIPFGVAVLVTTLRSPVRNLRTILLPCLLFTVGVVITFGPWMLKNLVETGNPVYPLLYSVFGGADWNDELQAKWKNAHPSLLLKPGWGDVKGVLFENDWQSPLLFGLAPLAFFGRNKKAVLGVTLFAAYLLAAWYLFTHRIDRFWVPMNSIMAVLAGCGLASVLGLDVPFSKPVTSSKKKIVKPAVVAIHPGALLRKGTITALVAFAVIYNLGFITTSLCGFNAYLMDLTVAREQTLTRSVAILEWMKLPPGSKVLFVGEAELFNARFPYAYCTVFDQNLLEQWTAEKTAPGEWNMRSPAEIRRKLHDEGITHVFVNWNEILRYRTTYRFTDFVTPARLQQLVELSILRPLPLPESISTRPWDGVDASWQNEIERWSPDLKVTASGAPAMLQFQAFQVTDEPASQVQ